MTDSLTELRMDKWLWAARFYKTRALAAKACELGRVHARVNANEVQSKASRDVRIGDQLRIRNDAGEFQVEVLSLSAVRGPAAIAQALFRESEQSRGQRAALAAEQKALYAAGLADPGRPSKQGRREINRFRGR